MTNPDARIAELRSLGYTGIVDADGAVASHAVAIENDAREELTDRLLALYRSMQGKILYRGEQPGAATLPRFYLQTSPRHGHAGTERIDWFANAADLAHQLVARGITAGPGKQLIGTGSSTHQRWVWGPVPPADVLAELPTRETFILWSHWFIMGAGRVIAERMPCAHQYHLTDSCPGCDADEEADATVSAPTGRERDGEHWNARLIRWAHLREISETGKTPETAAAAWDPAEGATPEQRRELLEVVTGPTETERAYAEARRDVEREENARLKLQAGLENQMVLALQSTRDAMNAHVSAFAIAVRQKGALRAVQLHAKESARLDIQERVWDRGVTVGAETEDWVTALRSARTYAFEQLRHNATARTRNRVDNAMAQIMVDHLSDLIDAMDGMLDRGLRETGATA